MYQAATWARRERISSRCGQLGETEGGAHLVEPIVVAQADVLQPGAGHRRGPGCARLRGSRGEARRRR